MNTRMGGHSCSSPLGANSKTADKSVRPTHTGPNWRYFEAVRERCQVPSGSNLGGSFLARPAAGAKTCSWHRRW
jgi:hypothetical protein